MTLRQYLKDKIKKASSKAAMKKYEVPKLTRPLKRRTSRKNSLHISRELEVDGHHLQRKPSTKKKVPSTTSKVSPSS